VALDAIPGDQDLATKALADLRIELEKEKAARETSRIVIDPLIRV
jgi:hypothetical protein